MAQHPEPSPEPVVAGEIEGDERRAAVWAVSSGKGGVGKTSLSLNLGIVLARSGKQVLLVDADLGLANVDIMLGVSPERTLQDVLREEASAFDVLVEGPEGLTILPSATGIAEIEAWQPEDLYRLGEELGRLERGFDLILIDTGAGISSKVVDFVLAADRMLVVAVPEPTSIADAYAMVKVCHGSRPDLEIGLLVNRARSAREAFELNQKFNQIVDRFLGAEVFRAGHVLYDAAFENAARNQQPLVVSHPDSTGARCIEQIASELAPESADLKRTGPGLFDRLIERATAGTRA